MVRFMFEKDWLYLASDINECSEGLSSCNQWCINTVGSYACDCYSGFALGTDNHTCEG